MNSHTFKREMTITHADFFRLLPMALGSDDFTVNESAVEFVDDKVVIHVTISPEQNWKIGALSLPKTRVEIRIDGCEDTEAEERIRRFDRAYQKGGG